MTALPASGGCAFTLGPWAVHSREAFDPGEFAVEAQSGNDGKVIALCYGPDVRANAHLIAASPKLYEALVGLLATHKGGAELRKGQCCEQADDAIDALLLARGEQVSA